MPDKNLDYEHIDFLIAAREAITRAIRDHEQAAYWKSEADEWRHKYMDILNDSVKSSGQTIGSLVQLIVAGKITVPDIAEETTNAPA